MGCFATKIYFPIKSLSSFSKKTALSRRRALFLVTAFPTFFEVTNAMSNVVEGLKKATKEGVCHFLPLL